MRVILFAPRFVPPILAGTKLQTIRGVPRRAVRPGQVLSLRAWSGTPYRSPQEVLGHATCSAVEPIRVEIGPRIEIEVSGIRLGVGETSAFVRADGFAGPCDFLDYWERHRPSTFEGILIRWEPI